MIYWDTNKFKFIQTNKMLFQQTENKEQSILLSQKPSLISKTKIIAEKIASNNELPKQPE